MLTLDDIITAVPEARIEGSGADRFTRASIDTRDLVGGELFVAVPGATRDGHDFVGAAVAAGATGVLVARAASAPAGIRVIQVPDTLEALQRSGAAVRARSDVTVVAVTGSAGKTTAKTMIAQVLGSVFPVLANQASFNNHLGVPLTLTAIDPEHTHVVVEVGTNHPGEIAHLAGLVRPDIAVVTTIGWAHIGNFADQAALAQEKTDLLRAVRPGGVRVVNGDDPHLNRLVPALPDAGQVAVVRFGFDAGNDVRAVDVTVDERGTYGTLHLPGGLRVPFSLSAAGRHFAYAAMLAVAVAGRCGIEPPAAVSALVATPPPAGRAAVVRQGDGLLVVDDTYNGSPDAMLSSLDLLGSLPGRMKIAVLGEMRELGAASVELHQRVGRAAAAHASDLVTVGDEAAPLLGAAQTQGLPATRTHSAASAGDALRLVQRILAERDRSIPLTEVAVLAKGSRFRHMERVPLGLGGRTVTCPRSLCTLYITCGTCDYLS